MHRTDSSQEAPSFRRAAIQALIAGAAAVTLAGCLATTPTPGSGSGTAASGSAGGANASNANQGLEKCDQTMGTLAIDEDTSAQWYGYWNQQYKLGSTVPLLRLIIQQSNCFVVVERGSAMNNMMRERQLRDSGELRQGSNMQRGQIVAADYTMKPSIAFSEQTGGGMAGIGGLIGGRAGALASIAGSMRQNEASTTLLLIDNRSGVQLAASTGSASNMDFGLLGGMFGSSAGGVAGGYSRTPEGRVITAAFVDSYNNMVKSVRSYRAQNVRGGLGTGGSLGVQGGQTPAAQQPAARPSTPAAPAKKSDAKK